MKKVMKKVMGYLISYMEKYIISLFQFNRFNTRHTGGANRHEKDEQGVQVLVGEKAFGTFKNISTHDHGRIPFDKVFLW